MSIVHSSLQQSTFLIESILLCCNIRVCNLWHSSKCSITAGEIEREEKKFAYGNNNNNKALYYNKF